jgi:hypothetical protein
MAGGRASAIEQQQRRDHVLRMLASGHSATEVVTAVAEEWGISRRQARRVVADGHAELTADWVPVQAADVLAQLVVSAQRIARRAEEAEHYSAAVGAIRTVHQMVVEPHRNQHHQQRVRRWS